MDQMDGAIEGQFFDSGYGAVESATSAPSVHYVNEAGVAEDVMMELRNNTEIASIIERWSQTLSSHTHSTLDVFGRNKWQGTRHVFAQMSMCAWAVENDDILSTLADVTEALSFNRCRFDLYDDDQEDVWNQWAGEIDLDSLLRASARELFKVSQVYVGLWWGRRKYTVRDLPILDAVRQADIYAQKRQEDLLKADPMSGPPLPPDPTSLPGPGKGNRKRKKEFLVDVPTAATIFDPTKILPVGMMMFDRERFAYVATRQESEAFQAALDGDVVDSMVLQLIERKYTPSASDRQTCGELGVSQDDLWLMRKDAIFRHTLTKAQYETFASIRLKAVLPILDLKDHLRAADRAALMGNANFIVVITKGTDKLPAKPAEIENLREQAKVVARLPVLVGDHRLQVTIVAPPLDNTLIESRWQVLDSRLVFTALKSFQPIVQGGNASGGVSEMSRVVSQGLDNRRHQLVRALERFMFAAIVERNENLDESPSLEFQPKRISLDVQADVLNALLKLRDRGDISRETTLEEFGYDEDVEVLRRAKEKMYYDRIFSSSTPYSSPAANPFGAQQDGSQPPAPGQPPAPAPAESKKKTPPKQASDAGRPPGSTDSQPRTAKAELDEE
jgi:hypothetical protein